MFEKEIEIEVTTYISHRRYLEKHHKKISIAEDITNNIYEATPSPNAVINTLIEYPSLHSSISKIVKQEFPLLDACIDFMRKENIRTSSFNDLLSYDNHKEFEEVAEALKLRIIQEELKPYADRLFNELPLMESRANDLFKKERQ